MGEGRLDELGRPLLAGRVGQGGAAGEELPADVLVGGDDVGRVGAGRRDRLQSGALFVGQQCVEARFAPPVRCTPRSASIKEMS